VVLGSSRRAADLAQVSTSASDAPERC
jgi:hypothetical protein